MSIKLPLPADVDLSDMPYYPVNDPRLKKSKSWRRAKHWQGEGPGLGFCLFNLWTAAFRCVPAASLPDDDDDLAEDAECSYAYWLSIKDDALRGWELVDGRWWHHVVAGIAWELWRARLKKKHESALDSHRAAAKRANDKGLPIPAPPGSFVEWLAAVYPATSAYIAADEVVESAERPPDVGATNGEKATIKDLSEAKVSRLTPRSPPGAAEGQEQERQRKYWFAAELARVSAEIGQETATLLTVHMAGGKGHGAGQYHLVEAFKGCFRDRAGVIVLPSKRRLEAVTLRWRAILEAVCPEQKFRFATVDELRQRKVIAA